MAQVLTGIYSDNEENKENMEPHPTKLINVGIL